MIVDASALLAAVLDESDGRRFGDVIAGAPQARLPAAAWFEAAVAVDLRGTDFSQTDVEPALKD